MTEINQDLMNIVLETGVHTLKEKVIGRIGVELAAGLSEEQLHELIAPLLPSFLKEASGNYAIFASGAAL